jgi:uncharacterized protein
MGRLLVLIVLVVVAVWLIRRSLARMNARGDAPPANPVRDELVRCAHCGLLLPRAEARIAAGAIYCSEEHARLGPTRGPGGR